MRENEGNQIGNKNIYDKHDLRFLRNSWKQDKALPSVKNEKTVLFPFDRDLDNYVYALVDT